MTFYLPNTDIIPVGSEPAEFIETPATPEKGPQHEQDSLPQPESVVGVRSHRRLHHRSRRADWITGVIMRAAKGIR
jgi:hypothetical protein